MTSRKLNYQQYFNEKNNNFRKYKKFLDKKKIDLFTFSRILIPVLIKNKTGSFSEFLDLGFGHKKCSTYSTHNTLFKHDKEKFHWALVSVNLKNAKMILYDSKYSFSEDGKNAMQALSKFFDFYVEDKFNNSFSQPNTYRDKNFSQTDNEFSDMRFDSEGSSDDEDIPENSTQVTTNQTFNLEDDLYSNCKRVLNFDEANDTSVDKEGESGRSCNRWKFKYANNPTQSINNEADSGVFVCRFIEYITRDEPILFDKHDIEYFRILMSVELIESKLMTG
jgi:hypothetical protein